MTRQGTTEKPNNNQANLDASLYEETKYKLYNEEFQVVDSDKLYYTHVCLPVGLSYVFIT